MQQHRNGDVRTRKLFAHGYMVLKFLKHEWNDDLTRFDLFIGKLLSSDFIYRSREFIATSAEVTPKGI